MAFRLRKLLLTNGCSSYNISTVMANNKNKYSTVFTPLRPISNTCMNNFLSTDQSTFKPQVDSLKSGESTATLVLQHDCWWVCAFVRFIIALHLLIEMPVTNMYVEHEDLIFDFGESWPHVIRVFLIFFSIFLEWITCLVLTLCTFSWSCSCQSKMN